MHWSFRTKCHYYRANTQTYKVCRIKVDIETDELITNEILCII